VTLEGAEEAYWAAVSAGDERSAVALVADALTDGADPEALLALVTRAQLRVGELWQGNHWTVPHEHAATAAGEAAIRRLAEDVPEPLGGPLLLVGCVDGEWHAMPALVVAQSLRHRGFRVDYLGANASRDHVVSHVADRAPRAVLLSASLTSILPRVRRHVEAVRATGTPVVVGGRAFDAEGVRARRLGATAYAADPDALVVLMPELPHRVLPAPTLRLPSATEARDLQAMADDVGRDVTAALRVRFGFASLTDQDALDDWRVVLATYVPHVVGSLLGALLTGDGTIMPETRVWLTDVLAGRDAPAEVPEFLWNALEQRLHDHTETRRLLAAR
jgi:methanogenic corrinoid protein MtbC1